MLPGEHVFPTGKPAYPTRYTKQFDRDPAPVFSRAEGVSRWVQKRTRKISSAYKTGLLTQ